MYLCAEYEDLAVAATKDSMRLAVWRARVEGLRHTSRVFDTTVSALLPTVKCIFLV